MLRPREEWVPLGGAAIEPVISTAQFERVAAILARNINTLGGRPSDRYLLKSLVWCRACGHRCKGQLSSGGRYTRYGCSHRDRVTGEQLCKAESVLAPALEKCVWDAAMETLGDERTLRAAVEAHVAGESNAAKAGEVARIQARIEALKRVEFKARREELNAPDQETAEFYTQSYREAMRDRRALENEVVTLLGKGATGKVDFASIARDVQAERHCDITDSETRGDVQELLRKWVERVDYRAGEAEISLRVPLQAARNCQPQQPAASSFILLKLKRRVA